MATDKKPAKAADKTQEPEAKPTLLEIVTGKLGNCN